MSKSGFVRTKEAAVWGVLYGFQQDNIPFKLAYMFDVTTANIRILTFTWDKPAAPILDEDFISCTAAVNGGPPLKLCIPYADVIGLIAMVEGEIAVGVSFMVETAGGLMHYDVATSLAKVEAARIEMERNMGEPMEPEPGSLSLHLAAAAEVGKETPPKDKQKSKDHLKLVH